MTSGKSLTVSFRQTISGVFHQSFSSVLNLSARAMYFHCFCRDRDHSNMVSLWNPHKPIAVLTPTYSNETSLRQTPIFYNESIWACLKNRACNTEKPTSNIYLPKYLRLISRIASTLRRSNNLVPQLSLFTCLHIIIIIVEHLDILLWTEKVSCE